MGGGDEPCDGVFGAAVTRWAGSPRAVGRDVFRHPGDGSVEWLQLVPGAVASVVLGAFAAGFRSDARPWGASAELGEALLAQAHQMCTWWHRVREGTVQ